MYVRPCPDCGSRKIDIIAHNEGMTVKCSVCGKEHNIPENALEAFAIREWNYNVTHSLTYTS